MSTRTRTRIVTLLLGLLLACLPGAYAATPRGGHGCGLGVHYWRNVDDGGLNRVHEDGAAWVAGYQYRIARMLAVQSDMEMYPRRFIAAESKVYAPVVYLLAGAGIYGGLGTGVYISDGERSQSPFYVTRTGLELQLVPQASIDLSLNYRVASFSDIGGMFDDLDFQSISMAVMVRYQL